MRGADQIGRGLPFSSFNGHGNFMTWIEANCDFNQTAANVYMRAAVAQINGGPLISSLSELLRNDRAAKLAVAIKAEAPIAPVPDAQIVESAGRNWEPRAERATTWVSSISTI